jgi:hypothetical protein
MNREMNPFEFQRRSQLFDLKKEYHDLMRTVEILQASENLGDAAKIQQKAQSIAAEIIKLDPDFTNDLGEQKTKDFKAEADWLNKEQFEKPDYKELN